MCKIKICEILFSRELRELIYAKENKKWILAKRSLQSMCIEKIMAHKKEICQRATKTGINPMAKLSK